MISSSSPDQPSPVVVLLDAWRLARILMLCVIRSARSSLRNLNVSAWVARVGGVGVLGVWYVVV